MLRLSSNRNPSLSLSGPQTEFGELVVSSPCHQLNSPIHTLIHSLARMVSLQLALPHFPNNFYYYNNNNNNKKESIESMLWSMIAGYPSISTFKVPFLQHWMALSKIFFFFFHHEKVDWGHNNVCLLSLSKWLRAYVQKQTKSKKIRGKKKERKR